MVSVQECHYSEYEKGNIHVPWDVIGALLSCLIARLGRILQTDSESEYLSLPRQVGKYNKHTGSNTAGTGYLPHKKICL